MSVNESVNETSPVHRLAKRLENDIRCRGLREGARYLNTVEAGHMLGVSSATAHRALRLLANRRVVVRRSKLGTFVGPRVGSPDDVRIRTVYVLVAPEQRQYASARYDAMIRGMCRSIPDINVQFSFMPQHKPVEFVRKLLAFANSDGEAVGVVAVSSPVEVYRFLADSGVPTVISGTPHLAGPKLPSVDLDNREAGRLLAQYLIDRGHRRIALVATTLSRPGDKLLFDGISEALTAARLPHNSLVFQIVSQDTASVSAAVDNLLSTDDHPTGFIARNEGLSRLVNSAVSAQGSNGSGDVEIVFIDHTTERVEQSPYTHVQTQLDRQQSSELIGKMLNRLSEGQPLDQQTVVIPVELCNGKPAACRES